MPRVMAVTVLTVGVVVSVALAACGGNEQSGSVALNTAPTTTTTATTVATTVAPASTATTGQTPATAAPATPAAPEPTSAAEDLSGFQTEGFRRDHPFTQPVPQVAAVRFARHPGFDRVVFDFSGPLPGVVSVRYVDRVVADASGDPVTVAGAAFLDVRFEGARAHNDAGASTISPRTRPGLSAVSDIVLTGDAEGTVSVALGLAARTSFRVLELASPTRVVVDVRAS